LERCHTISTEYIEDNGGLYDVLTSEEQIHMDVAYEREQRREKQGYVSPSTAASFLSLIRVSKLTDIVSETSYDTVTLSYFKTYSGVRSSQSSKQATFDKKQLPESSFHVNDMGSFVQVLQEAGVISSSESTLFLSDTREDPQAEKYPIIRSALRAIQDTDRELHTRCMTEMSYLANVLLSGCSFQDRSFRQAEAAEAALATCNLGLEYLRNTSLNPDFPRDTLTQHSPLQAFRVGWSLMFHQVSLHTAKHLTSSQDSRLNSLKTIARKCIEKGEPWQIRNNLDLLIDELDLTTISALKQFLDECPSTSASLLDHKKSQKISQKCEFISSQKDIEIIHKFLVTAI
jgi:hypothetical protein